MKELLTKKYAGLPGWAWLLIGVAGVGAGYLLIRWQQKKGTSSLTPANGPDLTTGNASGDETNSATGTVGANGVIDNPFPESQVNGQSVPVVPPGYRAVYDPNGNLIGWEPIATNPTPSQPPSNAPVSGLIGPVPGLEQPRYFHPIELPASTAPLSTQVADGATAQPTTQLSPAVRMRRVG